MVEIDIAIENTCIVSITPGCTYDKIIMSAEGIMIIRKCAVCSDYHWVESYEDGYGPCAGGDPLCSRDLDNVAPTVGGNGSGGFCSHDPDSSARSNRALGSLRNKTTGFLERVFVVLIKRINHSKDQQTYSDNT